MYAQSILCEISILRRSLCVALAIAGALPVFGQIATPARIYPPALLGDVGEFSAMARGDFDGDGLEDLAVGLPARDAAGRVVLTSGSTGQPIRAIFGVGAPEINDGFGQSVVAIEDLDGDGLSDLVVSVPGSIGAARVDAISGINGQRIWTRPSPSQGLAFGWSLKVMEDVDGDGKDDVIIGSPTLCLALPTRCGHTAATPNGEVIIASGANGAVLQALQNAGNPALSPGFGFALTSPGDIDGDQTADLVVVANSLAFQSSYQVQGYSAMTGGFLGLYGQGSSGTSQVSIATHDDINADGILEILIGHRTQPSLSTWTIECLSGSGSGQLWSFASLLGGPGLAVMDDINGDGVSEVIAKSTGNALQSGITLISGQTGNPIWSATHSTPFGAPLPIYAQPVIGDRDRDGDGVADILAVFHNEISGNRLVSYSGATAAVISSLQSKNGVEGFGSVVIATPDMDGDSRADLLVGAPRWSSGPLKEAGAAYLISTQTGGVIRRFEGTANGQQKGLSLADLGDVNGDAVSDFAVGSPLSITTVNSPGGMLEVHSGATGAILWTAAATYNAAFYAAALASLEDQNGDGVKDLAVTLAAVYFGVPSTIRILSGTNGALIRAITCSYFGYRFGSVLVNAGDLDGDGADDLLAELEFGNFQPFLSGGFGPSEVMAISGASGTELWRTTNSQQATLFGTSLAILNDRNGDGIPEILVGAPNTSAPSGTFAGSLSILSGSTGSILSTVAAGLATERLGVRVSALGDQNGDLIPEYAGLTNIFDPPNAPSQLLPVQDRLRVFSGSQDAFIDVHSSAPYATYLDSEGWGSSLTPISDLNGDGYGELVIGAPNAREPIGLIRQGFVDIISVRPSSSIAQQGSGCSLVQNGQVFTPQIGTAGGTPAVQTGNPNFAITLQGAPPNADAALFYAAPASTWNGLPLPIDLTPFGLPGCIAQLGADFFIPISLAGSTPPGSALISTPIPQNPSLSGIEVLTQWAIQSTTSAAPAFALTGALKITLK